MSAEARLAIGLRYLAGGAVLDLRLIYCVSSDECYSSIWRVVDAVNSHIKVEFPLYDEAKLQELESGFRSRSRKGVWRGCVAAIDGVHFKIANPGSSVSNSNKFYVDRKHCFALLCIALCDADRRFLYFDISKTPGTHDSLAWSTCTVPFT